jgi:guanosine-3',5'-bis(diphosphate) 3'-pyrophosphohydrolase
MPDVFGTDPRKYMMNDTQHLISAIRFAANAHRNQRRKDHDASPYINHPVELASILAVEAGITDIVTLQAAILHDTIEDTKVTYEALVQAFGTEVADVVMEVTDDKSLSKGDRKRAQVDHAPHKSPKATMVKLADKTANLRDIATQPPEGWGLKRKQEYFEWARTVVDALPAVAPNLRRIFDEAYRAKP